MTKLSVNINADILPVDTSVINPHTPVAQGALSDDTEFIVAWGTGGHVGDPTQGLYLHMPDAIVRLGSDEFVEQIMRSLSFDGGGWASLERDASIDDAERPGLMHGYRNDVYEVRRSIEDDSVRFRRIDGVDNRITIGHAQNMLDELLFGPTVAGVTAGVDGWWRILQS